MTASSGSPQSFNSLPRLATRNTGHKNALREIERNIEHQKANPKLTQHKIAAHNMAIECRYGINRAERCKVPMFDQGE